MGALVPISRSLFDLTEILEETLNRRQYKQKASRDARGFDRVLIAVVLYFFIPLCIVGIVLALYYSVLGYYSCLEKLPLSKGIQE